MLPLELLLHQNQQDLSNFLIQLLLPEQMGFQFYQQRIVAYWQLQLHIEICVLNSNVIKNYFLPRPLDTYNPYLNSTFILENRLS